MGHFITREKIWGDFMRFFECDAAVRKAVAIPIELYQSDIGRYFIAYADELSFGEGTSAWARLYNPADSGVDLHVNVWTVTDISAAPFRAQFWFNSTIAGDYSTAVPTPSNTAIRPTPVPHVELQLASNTTETPQGGIKAFVRRGEPGTTVVETENGKLIFPPGGSFLIYLSLTEDSDVPATGRIALGWWETPIPTVC
jgi:hypothetical protein